MYPFIVEGGDIVDIHLLKTTSKRYEILASMNILTLEDVVSYYPYRYEIIDEIYPSNDDDHIIIEAYVLSVPKVYFNGRLSRMSFEVEDRCHNHYRVTIFNRHFIRQYLKIGSVITILGKCNNNLITASDIKLKPLDQVKGIHPIYSLKEGINQSSFQNYVKKAYRIINGQYDCFVPEEMIIKHRLVHKDIALYNIHFPSCKRDVVEALRYLKYEEFLRFQLTMQCMHQHRLNELGIAKNVDVNALSDFILKLPFKLTVDQAKVTKEIVEDLMKPKVMYRFLQGDVGSGKTIVSCIGLFANYLAGFQGALMAPTEILARQHYQTLLNIFKNEKIKIVLLTGSLTALKKQDIYNQIKNGEVDIIVGTHALFQDKVIYHSLGLVITDEQHRFGVNQRKALKNKGHQVDFLVMSATPIPRTLAIAMYGDMDVSTIETKPMGRIPIITRYIKGSSMKPILKHLNEYLSLGGQCYVICPLVNESESIVAKNALQISKAMQDYFKDRFKVGLLHGQMKDDEKDLVMKEFLNNDIQILVSTTVVEVGVDVKNANMMVIYNAERFGMSQLHQLRGRIGRSNQQSYCYLMSSATNQEAIDRLKYLEENDNGFDISAYDLKMRGPGDFLGEKQSGLPSFILADVFKDFPILQIAREDAIKIINDCDTNLAYQDYIRKIEMNLKDSNEYID